MVNPDELLWLSTAPRRLLNARIIGFLIVRPTILNSPLPKLVKNSCKRELCNGDLHLTAYVDGSEYICLSCGRNYPVITIAEINQPFYSRYRKANKLVFLEEVKVPCQ